MSSSALAAGLRQLRRRMAVPEHRDDSDEQLLSAFIDRRDDNAFAVLVHRHGPMVLQVCRRLLGHEQDAEDAFQAAFLVLARKAASLRNKGSLASFLHGIVYRLAHEAKRSAARRREYEGQAPSRPSADPVEEISWREVRALLDEEIARLPEIYRSVFVLCHLEDLSRAEAAQRLGLKECTVLSRLATARKRLAKRLARRGVELTAVLAAATVTTQPAAALPAGLMASTVQAALAMTAGGNWDALVSASVVELVRSATAAMMASKIKFTAMLTLAVSLLTVAASGALVCWYGQPSRPFAAAADDKPKADSPQREAAKTVQIQGRVFDAEGKPKARAKILLLGENEKLQQLGETTADGRFAVGLPQGTKGRFLIAQAEGSGIDLVPYTEREPKEPIELRLVKDQAIRGRAVNTEGKPVRGARVAVKMIDMYANNSLDSLLLAWKKSNPVFGYPNGGKIFWSEEGALLRTTTDVDGRFSLHGIGCERLATLRISGAGIAEDEIRVATRAGFDPKPYNQATRDNAPKDRRVRAVWMLHGADVALVVEAEKPIRGTVKDAASGRGRPNVMVYLTRREENGLLEAIPRAKTNALGRYEIHGARKAKRYMLEVMDDPSGGYVAGLVWAEDTAGYDPINADISVKKGVVVTGKVIDRATGKPLPGFAMGDVLDGNPFIQQYDYDNPLALARVPGYKTAADGIFRIVMIPGPVLLMGRALDRLDDLKYKKQNSDPRYPQFFPKDPRGAVYLGRGGERPLRGNFCKVLEIKPDAKIVKQDIVLERASALPIRIQDAKGQPLAGVLVAGSGPENWGPGPVIPCEEAECAAYQLESGKPRLLIFFQPARKLAGTLALKGDEKAPVIVKLGPAGSIKGRLIDTDGKPLAGVEVDVQYHREAASAVHNAIHRTKQIVTDTNGAFALDELIPEMKFELAFRRSKRSFERESKAAGATIEIKPGECHDLGAIKLKRIPETTGE